MRFYTILVVLMLTVNGCSVLYDVSTNVELQTISKPKDSAKAGRTKIWLENKRVYDLSSVYYNENKDIFTIQKVDRGKLYALHGITTKVESFDKHIIFLIKKFNLTKVLLYKQKKYFSFGVLDNINTYITISKKNDELIYEYTDDMDVKEVKIFILAREKARQQQKKAQQKKSSGSGFGALLGLGAAWFAYQAYKTITAPTKYYSPEEQKRIDKINMKETKRNQCLSNCEGKSNTNDKGLFSGSPYSRCRSLCKN